jgi:hypothetical protein
MSTALPLRQGSPSNWSTLTNEKVLFYTSYSDMGLLQAKHLKH